MTTAREYRGTVYTDRRVADRQLEKLYAGKVCANGHEGHLRYVSTGQCSECVRLSNKEKAQARRESHKATREGSRLFAYKLHPDDHAAALAFCQGLDLQRGRMPQAAPAVDATREPAPSVLFSRQQPHALPPMIAERRRQLVEAAQVQQADHVPAELAGVLRNQSDER